MMKKILFALAFLVCLVSSAQIKPNHDGVNLTPLTTVEINALTGMLEGDIQYNSTTETLWRYNGTAWADTDSGLSSTDIDTFAELDAIVADKSLVNLEDAQTFAGINTFDNNLLLGSSASDANLFKLRHISTSNLNHQTLNYGVLYFQNDGQFTMGSGLDTNNISFDWTANTVGREYIWPDASGTIALTSDIGASGDLWSDPVDADIVPSVDNSYSLGSSTNFFDVGHFNRVVLDPITTGDFWTTDIVTGNHYGFGYLATPTTTFSELYTLNNTGTPSAATDLIDKAYADANYSGISSLPVDDTTSLIQDPVDNTKQLRIDVEDVTTGNTAILQINGNNAFSGFLRLLRPAGDGTTHLPIGIATGTSATQHSYPNFDGGNIQFQADGDLAISTNISSVLKAFTLNLNSLTAARDYTLPDASGTIALTSDITGGSFPVDDTTSLVQDPVDNTKQVRIDAGAITTATTRTITMPDADVDLGNIPDLNTVSPPNTLEYARFSDSNTLEGLTAAEVRTDLNIENNAAADQTASEVPITDAGGYFTGTDVETMGQEIGADLADRPTSLGTGRTSPVQYSDIYGQTQANYNTDGAPSAGELVIITDASPAEVVTSATVAMDGWKMYDDQTADAATITLSDCDPGETLTVYINRASAPTLAGTGLTFNALPNTTAFAAATEMMMIFEVAYDGTTIDYYYVER